MQDLDLLRWPDPLPSSWQWEHAEPQHGWAQAYRVSEDGLPRGTVQVALAARHAVGASYPAGLHDRILAPSEDAPAEAIQLASEAVMAADPRCRRLVLACPEGDIPAIARAEAAGYRYVVDVDLPGGTFSLLAAEPEWVLEESRNIDEVPTA
jgi:hypothetical protein